MTIERSDFGQTADGKKVSAYRVTNSKGAYITVIDFGAVLVDVVVPDRSGSMKDVVLGYHDVASYEKNPSYFGATVGRNANRIEGGCFAIDGVEYELTANENGNNLHSGPDGYHLRMWETSLNEKNGCVSFTLNSPDGDQGFPGDFKVTVTYMLTEDNKVKIHYEGTASQDTIANMTNHSYFNLNGEGSGTIMEHYLRIDADGYTPVDEHAIPYGTVEPVEGTPFDFRTAKKMSQDADAEDEQLAHTGGYDHNFALNGSGLHVVAEAYSEESGISMTVMTDQPGMQFYAGNFISGPVGKSGKTYGVREGFCLETQHFPNAVNVLAFDSPRLNAGERYSTTTCYTFGIKG
ncbi:MAG: aldose epimerase family protein [Lachnospiraceae bacterium]|nr:aldose epimerase family protein [Lachnospiraceae bacterium]